MKLIKIVLIVFVVFGVSSYLINAVITTEQVRQIENGANNPKSASPISAADGKREFMRTCDDNSLDGAGFDQTSYCGCVYDSIVAEKGINWLANQGLNSSESELSAAIQPYVDRCIAIQTT